VNAIVGRLNKTREYVRGWIVRELLRRQKPELDERIDEMLKASRVNRMMVSELGVGKKIGSHLKGFGRGLSTLKGLF
jgi:hypothetical protein